MRVGEIKRLLEQYSDDTELMIAWNSKENLEYEPDKISDELWTKIVDYYDESDYDGFHQDCLSILSHLKEKEAE